MSRPSSKTATEAQFPVAPQTSPSRGSKPTASPPPSFIRAAGDAAARRYSSCYNGIPRPSSFMFYPWSHSAGLANDLPP